uniref:uncharacterized protein LOC120345027 isoform X2 n=1 Tax=Styela clava TaxID=7725 RepID=UPI001939ED36|nr:uncharacterized protein LOC120345027 isoform X2 [Styela clava]
MKEKIKSCWFICLFLVPKFYIVVAEDKYCEAIEKLQYGDIVTSKQPPYTVGTILTYKCDRGYRIQGKHIVTCLEDRKWSDPAPYCIALSCKRDLSMIEAERKCRKPCQKDADCKGGNKRCVCDDWCGKSCFNPSAPCPALLHPENGYIIGKEFSYGKTVTYGCDQGFVLTGPTTRKCRSNRKWSGHVPKCIALSTCGQTEQKEKSMLYGKVILGTEVQIGAWPWQILLFTNKKHHTTQIYDPNSGFGGGSIINNKWILSAAHVFYERFPMGFFKKDWKKRFLIAVGMTKHPMPGEVIPDRINIFEPQHLHAHAKFDGSSYDYDIALIRIGNRLKVVGNKFVVDSQASSGSLTFTRYIRPVCLPCMKGHPFSPVNILERYDTNLCSRNIRGNNPNIPVRAGDETMVTGFGWKRSSGFVHWDKPKVMQEGRLKVQKDEKCINSVKLMQKEDKSARYTDRMICAKSADKSKNIDACEGDSGGPLVKRFGIQHSRYWMQVGIVSWGWGCGNEHPGFYTSLSSVMDWVWSVLNKTKTGYAMSGNPDITCQSDLTWSLPQFLCTVINCGQPHIPRNGYIKGESYLSGDWVEYYCDQGFRFTVSNATYRRRCMSSGVWSGESINCESEVLCSLPSIISGTIKGSEPFKVGSIVFFVCNDGYKISGNSLLTCSENGLWNPPPPKCTIDVNCDFDKSDRKLCAYTNEGDVEWKRDFESDSRLGLPSYIMTFPPQSSSSKNAILRSPIIPSKVTHCLQFYYMVQNQLKSNNDVYVGLNGESVGGIAPEKVIVPTNRWVGFQKSLTPKGENRIVFEIVAKGSIGFSMDDIELVKEECVSPCENENPCMNDGQCIDEIKESYCSCTQFYKGPRCEKEIVCSKPWSFPHGTIKAPAKIRYGTTISYLCNAGYRSRGNTQATCTEKGLSSSPPECIKIPQWTKNCPDGYKELVDSCYRQYSGPKNYEKAKKICENDGGHLANVQSKRVNEFLWENTWGSSAHYWIGLRNVDSNMLWSNGEKFERGHGIDFDLSGATSNNCGKYYYRYQAWVTKAWQIRFDDCSEKTRFICEKWKDNVNNYVVETSKDNYLPKIEGVYKPVSGLLTFEEKRQIYRKENDFDMYLFYEYHSGLNKRNWFIGGYSIPLGKPSHQYEVRTYSNVIEPDGIKTQWKDSYGRSIDITIEKHDMWQEWSEWECDVICGPGKKVRTRSCKNGAAGSRDCKGETWQEDVCNSDCGTSQVHNKKDLELDHNGIMYLFKTDKVSWDVAKMNCANVGSILAKSTGRDVQRKLGEKILQILNVDGIATNYWINGIYDTNTWRFQDGTVIPRDQRLWNKHEPNRDGTGRDCVEISPTGWNDKGCAIRRRYICQKESMKKGPCYPDPCNDRGNCRVGIDGDFICHCRPPFSGKSCERGDEFSIE